MTTPRPALLLAAAVAALIALSACGSDDEATDAGDDATTVTSAGDEAVDQDEATEEDDDHAEDDHAEDDDHAEEDEHGEDDDHAEDDEEGDHDEHGEDDEHKEDDDHDHDDEGAEGGLGAHEHGAAELSLAWSDGDMVIDLVSPTYNIFGFEYEATSEEDLAIVADQTEALTEPGVLVINAEAGCTTDDVMTDTEYEGSHAEITASWTMTCENPDEIKQLDATALFAGFPNLEDVDAQWASDSGQSAAELSPATTVVDLG
ncbi:MAG: ZrgA family zinc uptake protein [Acidimicrobiales bacterium]